MHRLSTSKKSVGRVDLHNDDVAAINLLVLYLLIWIRDRRKSTMETLVLIHVVVIMKKQSKRNAMSAVELELISGVFFAMSSIIYELHR